MNFRRMKLNKLCQAMMVISMLMLICHLYLRLKHSEEKLREIIQNSITILSQIDANNVSRNSVVDEVKNSQEAKNTPNEKSSLFSHESETISVYDIDSYFGKEFGTKSYLPSVIPPILHIQWKSNMVPDFAKQTLTAWKELHPNWSFMLWTDAKMLEFAKFVLNEEMMRVYTSLGHPIQRVDFMRYVILYHMGGVYADIDVLPLMSLEPLRKHSCVISREPEPYLVSIGRKNQALMASIHFMMSRPWHPLFREVLSIIKTTKGGGIFHHTGVGMINRALQSYSKQHRYVEFQDSVFLAPSLYFYPPPKPQGDSIHLEMLGKKCPAKITSEKSFYHKVCQVFRQENRIDWSAMYLHERFYNGSFVKHLQFNSWNGASNQKKSVLQVKEYIDIASIFPNYIVYQSSDETLKKPNMSAFEDELNMLAKYK